MMNKIGKKTFGCLVWVLCALTGMQTAKATHIFGGELLYKHVVDSTYVLELTLYGDCAASIFNTLYAARPIIYISSASKNIYNVTDTLRPIYGTGIEVSAVCAGMKDQTTCNNGTLPGIKQFIYTDTFTISRAPDWVFEFTSEMGSSSAGRSSNITNVYQPSASNINLTATLNNEIAPNSSPAYSTIPTPYYCLNVLQQYNQGAVDINNDSLSFALVPAITNNNLALGYIAPYTPEMPLAAQNFAFSSINGQMNFLPDQLQNSLVVNQVTEYRNGKIVGTSMREMTFIVLGNCQNNPPTGDLVTGSVTGGTFGENNIINVCKTSTEVAFTIAGADVDTDNVAVTINNLPAGATLNVTQDSTNKPALVFHWDITNVPPSIYTFYVNYTDDHCPITSSQTIAYTINVVNPNTFEATIVKPTECLHYAQLQYLLSQGTLPRTITIKENGNVVHTLTDSTGIVTDSLPPGNYTVSITSRYLDCGSEAAFVINDSGTLPTATNTLEEYCRLDELRPLNILVNPEAGVQWYDDKGNVVAGTPHFSTDVAGLFTWYVQQQFKVCSSNVDTFSILVRELPQVVPEGVTQTVCLGDIVDLPSVPGVQYTWSPVEEVIVESDGRVHTRRIMSAITYTVTGVDEYGCNNSAYIPFTNIEPCCKLSYPDAFTPNGDGKNDMYHVVTYGNMETFDLRIYNRWGNQVFNTNVQGGGWDGTYQGVPCDMGVYYYQLNAKCMTGTTEFHKGAITLIR